MPLYKPSNMQPSLSEIDITKTNTFSAQINSSGSTVKAYKFQLWSGDGNELLYDGNSQTLGVNHYIKNKGTLEFSVTPSMLGSSNKMKNGRDFQYGIRVYEAPLGSSAQPQTFVCSGFLVGTTKYVIWTLSSPTLLEEGKYVEITASSQSAILPPTAPNQDNITYPKSYPYKERHRIEFVNKELGWSKNITKLELDEPFTYNYPDGTAFQVYNCSNQHTLTSVYVDPNDIIERGLYIKISDTSVNGSSSKWRKIIGYGEETGEIRVQEPFNNMPKNGMTFTIGKMNVDNDNIEAVSNTGTNVVGGVAVNGTFTTMSNVWNGSTKRLFIQPNINIKSDATNFDELVFDINGIITRVDILQSINTTGTLIPGKKTVDTTFNKLDNTQWLLESGNLRLVTGSVPVSPQTPYQVFTDFQDSSPLAYFYARKTPNLRIQFKNYNDPDEPEYKPQNIPTNIDSYLPGVPWRDIYFQTQYTSANNVQIKYYQYRLYIDDETEPIAESEEKYDTDLDWYFRGFQTPDDQTEPGKIYRIEIRVVDEYNKEFIESNQFRVSYKVEQSFVPISTTLNCDERCMEIKVTTPAFVKTTDWGNKKTVTEEDLDRKNKYLSIPADKVLNYTNLKDIQSSPYTIPNNFTLYTQFQITGDFADQVKTGEELMVLEFSYENQQKQNDVVKLTFGGITSFYMEDDQVVTNEKRFKLMLYINDEPANLFKRPDGTMVNYIDLTESTDSFITATNIRNALQYVDKFISSNTFPNQPVENTVYVLNNTLIYNGITYKAGPYTWSKTKGWEIQSQYEYFFLENTAQVPGGTHANLDVPPNCQGVYGAIKWQDINNIWIDTENVASKNKENLNRYWFEFYFVSKGSKKTCQLVPTTVRAKT